MIFDDDFIQLELPDKKGTVRVTCKQLGIKNWPPPPLMAITGGPMSSPVYKRTSYSPITDEQRQKMTRVCRGAIYRHLRDAVAMTGPGPGKTIVMEGSDE